jgi:hypothetical protein
MNTKIDVAALAEDIWWGILPVVGMLASAAFIAVVIWVSVGKF